MSAGTPNLRRVSGVIRLLAWVLVPALFWLVSWSEYRLPTLLSLPILLFLSTPLLAALLALHLAVVVAMALVEIPRPPDVLIAGTAILGIWFGYKHALFIRVADPNTRPWRIVARAAAVLRFFALCAAILLPAFALFRGFPWAAYLLLALGYFALSRFLVQFAPVLIKSFRTAVVNAAILLIASTISFAVLELGARYLIKLPPPRLGLLDMMVPNKRSLWMPRPNLDIELSYQSQAGEIVPFTVHHSSLGLRGPEAPAKQPGEFRVVMLGDSFTYGWNVSQGEDVPAQLQDTLRAAHADRPVAVFNLGVPAYAPWQELEWLKQCAPALEPDLVIVQLFPANDITESLTKFGRTLPAFGQWETHKRLFWEQQQNRAPRVERWLRAHSTAYDTFRTSGRGGRGIPGLVYRFRLTEGSGAINVDKGAARTYWLEALRTEWYPDLELSWIECQKDVLAIADWCRERNIDVLVYSIPLNVFTDDHWQVAFTESSRNAGETIAYEAYKDTRLMEKFLTENNVPWMPLLDPLQATGRPNAFFISGDGHLNPNGCRFVAQLLADRVAAQGVLGR